MVFLSEAESASSMRGLVAQARCPIRRRVPTARSSVRAVGSTRRRSSSSEREAWRRSRGYDGRCPQDDAQGRARGAFSELQAFARSGLGERLASASLAGSLGIVTANAVEFVVGLGDLAKPRSLACGAGLVARTRSSSSTRGRAARTALGGHARGAWRCARARRSAS